MLSEEIMQKKLSRIVLSMAILLLFTNSIFAQTAAPHPRIFYTLENVKKLKAEIDTDAKLKRIWAKMLKEAKDVVKKDRDKEQDLELLGLAYLMTGEEKFAEKAKGILLKTIERDHWAGSGLLKRDPPWQAGLDVARTTFATAIGFDCIYQYLTESERRTIAEGIARLGVLPALNDWIFAKNRFHSFDSMGHNWWSACVYMAGIGALSIADEVPEAEQWAMKVSQTARQWFSYNGNILENKTKSFDEQGGMYESVNYAAFGISEYLYFRLAWSNAYPNIPPQEIPNLEKHGDFFLHASYPNSGKLMSVNFGDGTLTATGERPIKLLSANGIHKDSYDWYLDQVQHNQFREGLDNDEPLGLLLEATVKHKKVEDPGLPKSMMFADMGWATLRNSWDKDATLLAIKSGYTWNHAHADAGSFILFHNGEYLIIDSGNSSYASPTYTDYYCQSEAHNVVLFNGQGQRPEEAYFAVKNPGTIHHLLDAGDFKYVFADATGPYAHILSRNFRHFIWIGDVILIIDDLKAYETGKFEWLLHYNQEAKADRRGQDLSIEKNGAKVIVRPLYPEPFPDGGLPHDFPEKMVLEEKVGLQDHDPKTKIPYYAFSMNQESRRTKFVTAIILTDKSNPQNLPEIERFESDNMMGVRIKENGKVTNVYFNLNADGRIMHRPHHNAFFGWETDAYLTAITYREGADTSNPDNAIRYFIADGSYLRKDGKVVLNSLSKVYMIAEKKDAGIKIQVQGQPIMNIDFRAEKKPERITVNEKDNTTSYNSKRKMISILIDNVK